MAIKKASSKIQPNEVVWRSDNGELKTSEYISLTDEEENILLQIRHSGVTKWAMHQLGLGESPKSIFQDFSQECWEQFTLLTKDIELSNLQESIDESIVIDSISKSLERLSSKEEIVKLVSKLYLLNLLTK